MATSEDSTKLTSEEQQNVWILERGNKVATNQDVLDQLIQKLPIITNLACSHLDDDVPAKQDAIGEAVEAAVYILSPPHHCNCGSDDCSPVVNQTKLKQIMEFRKLILEEGSESTFLKSKSTSNQTSYKLAAQGDDTAAVGHKGEKKYPCAVCEKKFRSKGAVKKHSRRHTGVKPYKCKECTDTFTMSKLLRAHVKKHNLPIECPSCRQKFKTTAARDSHVKTHCKRHECDICHKNFSCRNHYTMHMVVHNEKRPHLCKHCGTTFKMAGNLSVHKKFCENLQQVHHCLFCKQPFESWAQWAAHQRTHTDERTFPCRFCTKCFRTRQHAKQHERIHNGGMPYACDKCKKRFKSPNAFANHKRQHDSHYPYTCEHCNKGFHVKRHLQEHVRAHTGEKPYPCSHCGRSFALKRTLVVHMRTHTGYKPWVCDHCGKNFITSGRLTEHFRIHTGERPYICQQCPKRFVQWQQLRAHKKTHKNAAENALQSSTPYPGQVVLSTAKQSDDLPVVLQIQTNEQEEGSLATNDRIQIIQAADDCVHVLSKEASEALHAGAMTSQISQEALKVACAMESLNAECEDMPMEGAEPYHATVGNIQVMLNCEMIQSDQAKQSDDETLARSAQDTFLAQEDYSTIQVNIVESVRGTDSYGNRAHQFVPEVHVEGGSVMSTNQVPNLEGT